MNELQRTKLVAALLKYDAKQQTKKGYNIYACSHYMNAVTNVRELCDSGLSLRLALVKSFNGRLLDVCLKALGEATSTRDEQWGRL